MKRALIYLGQGLLLLLVFIFATNVLVHATTRRYLYASASAAPTAEVALIPGAPILANGTPAPIYQDRVNTAIALYEAVRQRGGR